MTKRLKEISSHIKECEVFADVGCDHGHVCEFVLKNNLAKKVIASDISSKSLNKAKKLLSNYGEKVSYIISDGFNAFKEFPNQVVIAGMGGEEICSILKNNAKKIDRLILSPQKNQIKVRKLLLELGYKIVSDYTICDKKYYDIIVAEQGEDFYSDIELEFGRDNIKYRSKDFISMLLSEEQKCLNILKNKENSGDFDKIENYLLKVKGILYENK